MAYRTFIQCYKMKATIGSPSVANLYLAEATIAETVEEIDTTESQSGDGGASEVGFTDVYPGAGGAEITGRIQHRSQGTLVGTFKPGAELETFKIQPLHSDTTNAWSFTNVLVLRAEHPVQVKSGVWQVNFTVKTRGPYTRPTTMPT